MAAKEACVVKLKDQPMDLSLHPSRALVAAALITGRVQAYAFDGGSAARVLSVKAHSESCRAVEFSPGGAQLVSASTDKALATIDVEAAKLLRRQKEAHEEGINRLLYVDETTLASADDAGCIRLWDTRQAEPAATLNTHTDFVSDLAHHSRKHSLLSVSGDGTLAVHDLRTHKVLGRSEEDADDELLSVAVAKGGRKVVAGSQSGVLAIFSWGHFEGCSDRLPGHPGSVDALVAYDDDTVITGASDGIVRCVSILPNRMLGVLGAHASEEPVERLALSADRRWLASAAHDNMLHIWDVAYLAEEDSGDEGGAAQEAAEAAQEADSAGAPLEASDADSDEDKTEKSKKGKRKRGKASFKAGKKSAATGSFFDDLL